MVAAVLFAHSEGLKLFFDHVLLVHELLLLKKGGLELLGTDLGVVVVVNEANTPIINDDIMVWLLLIHELDLRIINIILYATSLSRSLTSQPTRTFRTLHEPGSSKPALVLEQSRPLLLLLLKADFRLAASLVVERGQAAQACCGISALVVPAK